MATPTTSYEQHIAGLQNWLQTTATNSISDAGLRDWCVLDLKDVLIAENIYEYFDTSDVNKTYQDEYDTVNPQKGGGKFTNNPVAYLQKDSDNLDGLSKMFIYRHQPRLKNYRDDCENKFVRTYSSLSLSTARHGLLKKLV